MNRQLPSDRCAICSTSGSGSASPTSACTSAARIGRGQGAQAQQVTARRLVGSGPVGFGLQQRRPAGGHDQPPGVAGLRSPASVRKDSTSPPAQCTSSTSQIAACRRPARRAPPARLRRVRRGPRRRRAFARPAPSTDMTASATTLRAAQTPGCRRARLPAAPRASASPPMASRSSRAMGSKGDMTSGRQRVRQIDVSRVGGEVVRQLAQQSRLANARRRSDEPALHGCRPPPAARPPSSAASSASRPSVGARSAPIARSREASARTPARPTPAPARPCP